jgi:hypothetical protein
MVYVPAGIKLGAKIEGEKGGQNSDPSMKKMYRRSVPVGNIESMPGKIVGLVCGEGVEVVRGEIIASIASVVIKEFRKVIKFRLKIREKEYFLRFFQG